MDTPHPDHSPQPSNRKWLILIAIGIGSFMGALDGSVVNTILPVVRDAFKSDVATVEWVVVVYLLAVSGLLLSFGRLGDLRGHKLFYLVGFFIFVGGSVFCGLSNSALALVAFRCLQAIGAGMLLANSPAILTHSFPGSQRGQALGLQATMTYLGLTTGPALGGWLTTAFSWRAVFYINVPVGLFGLVLSWIFIPADTGSSQAERFDLAGAVVFIAGLVALMLGLNQGSEWGWGSARILGLIAAAVVLLVIFVFIELRNPSPMLDLHLFGQRVFSAATVSAVMNYVALYSVIFLMPFYLIQGRGLNPAQAGLILTAQPLIMAVAAPISGTLSDRIGSRLPATLGMAILAAALLMLSRIGAQTHWIFVSSGLALAGLGTGIFISPNSSALMGSAPRNHQGIAAGILATARNVGMVLGIGLAGAILTSVFVPSNPATLFSAVSIGFLAAAGVALLSSLAAFVRGSEAKHSETTVPAAEHSQNLRLFTTEHTEDTERK